MEGGEWGICGQSSRQSVSQAPTARQHPACMAGLDLDQGEQKASVLCVSPLLGVGLQVSNSPQNTLRPLPPVPVKRTAFSCCTGFLYVCGSFPMQQLGDIPWPGSHTK